MPRRKAAERSQPHKSRSRNGCLTCRKRKIRCDEARPLCSNCRDKGLQCQRGVTLKWEQEYASRGLAFGRCGVWSKHGAAHDDVPRLDAAVVHWLPLPHIQPYHFVNSTVEGFEESLAEQEELSWFSVRDDGFPAISDRPGSSSSSVSGHSLGGAMVPFGVRLPISRRSPPAMMHSPSDFPQLENPSHAPLLHYYLERLCPLTTPSARSDSPFASLILPFSVQASSTALNSVLALSARHLSRMNRAWTPIAMQLEGKVLHSLRRRLMTEDPQKVALDPEVPTIMMLLCLYEIINKCDERWVVHLRGARDLIRTRRRLLPPSPRNALVAFSERFFAYQDVIGRTACGEVPIFGADYWNAADGVADAWLGCSPQLVSIVCAITELSRVRRSCPSFAAAAASLEARLAALTQILPAPPDAALARSAAAKRCAAVAYLRCALHGAGPATPQVRDLVRQILRGVAAAVDEGAAAGLAWPLFVAAVELDPVDDEVWVGADGAPVYGRPLVLRAFGLMAKSSIANVARMREVVSKVWERREREVAGSPGGDDGRNDWERFVAPLSINMSLVG